MSIGEIGLIVLSGAFLLWTIMASIWTHWIARRITRRWDQPGWPRSSADDRRKHPISARD